jgi:hypothetical protein
MGRARKGRRRRSHRTWLALGAVACLLALGVVAATTAGAFPTAGAPSPTAPPALQDVPSQALSRGREIVVGEDGGFSTANPLYAQTEGDLDLCAALFAPLQRIGADGAPVLDVATERTVSPDGGTVVFTLDPNRTFPDGQPVEPSDVAFTYGVLADPTYDGPLRGRFKAILSIAADDAAGTVSFSLAGGTLPETADAVLFTVGLLEASHYAYPYGKAQELRDSEAAPAGLGTYRLEELTSDRAVLVPRNVRRDGIERLVLLSVPEDRKIARLEDGTLDLARVDRTERTEARLAGLVGCRSSPYPGAPALYLLIGDSLGDGSAARSNVDRLRLLAAADALADTWACVSTMTPGPSATAVSPTATSDDAPHARLLYFRGVEPSVSEWNDDIARQVAAVLNRALPEGSPAFVPTAVGWPELATRSAAAGTFDALLLPAAEDGRVPADLRLYGPRESLGAGSDANATVLVRIPGTLLASRRLSGLAPNPCAYPFLPVGAGFLDALTDIVFLGLDGAPLPTASANASPTSPPAESPSPAVEATPTEDNAQPSGWTPRE